MNWKPVAPCPLERIFIENRIYRDIEEENTWEGVLEAIRKGLEPHISILKRAVVEETWSN